LLTLVKIRNPKAEVRPAATARQRGEKKPEARKPKSEPDNPAGGSFGFEVPSVA
jgi:hypothetical protein